jgi:hypothetical protein
MADPVRLVDPPATHSPITDAPSGQQQFTRPWVDYNQQVSDLLNRVAANAGVTDGSNAGAGQVGEWLSSVVASGGALANNIPVNVTTLPLTAGDWDVTGEVWFTIGSGPTGSVQAGISLSSAAFPGAPGTGSRIVQSWTHQSGAPQVLGLAPARMSLSAAGTAYLIAAVGYSSGSAPVAWGRIEARRVR